MDHGAFSPTVPDSLESTTAHLPDRGSALALGLGQSDDISFHMTFPTDNQAVTQLFNPSAILVPLYDIAPLAAIQVSPSNSQEKAGPSTMSAAELCKKYKESHRERMDENLEPRVK